VQPNVFRSGPAISVAIKSGHGLAATAAQLGAENVCGHGERVAQCNRTRHLKRDAGDSGERARLARWFWRLAKTIFPCNPVWWVGSIPSRKVQAGETPTSTRETRGSAGKRQPFQSAPSCRERNYV
jgi:hypothetical protein